MPTLTSPGVLVTIDDQSQYLPAAIGSVPLVVFATAQDKANPNGTGVAALTTAANAGKLFQITSQRELTTQYGTPFFYKVNGTPVQGYELNEYGLLAAYSALGVTNRVYCLRADIDLASLTGSTGRPTNPPANGSYWVDTTNSEWGIYEFNRSTGAFTMQEPIVIVDDELIDNGMPAGYLGVVGSYAVIATQPTSLFPTNQDQFFYKNSSGNWVTLGSHAWTDSVPSIVGTKNPSSLTAGQQFTVTLTTSTGSVGTSSVATITVPSSPDNTVQGVVDAINALGWDYLSASVNSSGQICIYSYVGVTIGGTDAVIDDLGISTGFFNAPGFVYGTSAQQPLWQSGQSQPHPTGSIWMKVGTSGNGLYPALASFAAATETWIPKKVNLATNEAYMINTLDATGGKLIPSGTIYGQYNYDNQIWTSPLYLYKRNVTGPTVVTGTTEDPLFDAGPYTLTIRITQPNKSTWSNPYTVVVPDNTTAAGFVTLFNASGIPYVNAALNTNSQIVFTHTEGGSIRISDIDTDGLSNGFNATAGFVAGTTVGCKPGYVVSHIATVAQNSTSGGGAGLQLSVGVATQEQYGLRTIVAAGSGYNIGDTVLFIGSDLGGEDGTNDLEIVVTAIDGSGGVVACVESNGVDNVPAFPYEVMLSNFVPFDYTANEGAPEAAPTNNQNWYYSVNDEVDIMVRTTSGWKGYLNAAYDSSGLPLPSGSNVTDPNGPIISATEPTMQSDETSDLVYGDLWIDVSAEALVNYPMIYRWQQVGTEDKWVLIDNSDQTSSNGVLFADARWSSSGAIDPVNDPIPTIKSLLSSNYIDLDAPTATTYPVGMLLFNTRRSGYNVKQFKTNYFTGANYPDAGVYNPSNPTNTDNLPKYSYTWVSASGLKANGSPYMGSAAQRNMVVKALNSVIQTNTAIRDEDNFFNLLATPNYPECQAAMIELNGTRNNTGYIIGDTPMTLPEDASAIQAWASNAAGATSTGVDGWVGRSEYMGVFYPSGTAVDLEGSNVAVPPSYMMLRTFLRNDTIAYPWFAAAGTRRGVIDNNTSIGYIDAVTQEFVSTKTRIGIRDVCYTNQINPLVYFTGNGFLNFGNKSSRETNSALDRTNVGRLVAYIRRQLTIAARPFIFEPNDALTRTQITGVVQSLMIDLVAKRGIYDYFVLCDDSNNTPETIDRNELYIDVAIEPVKAVEFIYIPVKIKNTGEIGGQ